MTALVLRSVLLAVVVIAALGLVRTGERRRGRRRVGLAPGLTLVTGPGCALCRPAEQALRAAGTAPNVIDVEELGANFGVTSLPVALVVGGDGAVVLRRSGRAVITEAGRIAAHLAAAR